MPPSSIQSIGDRLLTELDTGLRTIASPARATEPSPGSATGGNDNDRGLSADDRDLSARLMRVNHSGEIAAQALYRGQAFVTGDEELRQILLTAAGEEHDHLAWCEARVDELDRRTSLLGPVWYTGAFVIGAAAGLAGARISLGFLAETERQVSDHLDRHLDRLPVADARSRRIVARMKADEVAHGRDATQRGGAPLAGPVRAVMAGTARIMTTLSYWL